MEPANNSPPKIPPTDGFRPDVQALRGLAVLAVVAYHAGIFLPGGFVGVDCFFAISGFVIGRLLVRELSSKDRISFRSFYRRRARRLLPALGAMLVVVVVVSPVFAPTGAATSTPLTGLAAALFSANVYLFRVSSGGYFAPAAELNPLLHTWSLAVEEQFYFVIPALTFAAWKWGNRNGRPLVTLRRFIVVMSVTSFAASTALTFAWGAGAASRLAFFAPFTRAWEFGIGLLLVVLPAEWMLNAAQRTFSVVSGLALLMSSAIVYSDTTTFPGLAAVIPVLGTALMIHGGTIPTTIPKNTIAALQPLVWLGDLSYGWYLWHWPLIVFARAFWPAGGRLPLMCAAVASLLPAWLSYRYLEHRTPKARPKAAPKRLRPSFVLSTSCTASVVLIVGFAPLTGGNLAGRGTRGVPHQTLTGAATPHADISEGCQGVGPIEARSRGAETNRCVWGTGAKNGTVVLIGDSNAGQFSEALIGAAEGNGMQLRIATLNSCPFIDARTEIAGPIARPADPCDDFILGSLEYLVSHPPEVVVIANATDRYVNLQEVTIVEPNGKKAADLRSKSAAFHRSLIRTAKRLVDAGSQVVIIEVVPKPWAAGVEFDARTCSRILMLTDASRCTPPSFPANNSITSAANRIEAEAAKQAGARSWNFSQQLCPKDRCLGVHDGSAVWAEALHLSVAASSGLAVEATDWLRAIRPTG